MSQTLNTPFGQFYVMYKIHKGMKNGKWPTRPVCSDVSSLPHGLGKWITMMLQPIAQQQQSFFKDSFALKDLLDDIIIPSGAQLFTCDATSMYTNIRTGPAIEQISHYLCMECDKTFHHYDADAFMEAIHIVFENNIVAFGNTYWKQVSGTGMGISPAPPWATIYFGLFETELLKRWTTNVMFYCRFIDNVIGIWIPHPCPFTNATLWHDFTTDTQQWHGLQWTCEPPSSSINFMDLTISIIRERLETTLYEKPQNLYLYLPPHSSHPHGIVNGLIFGQVLRIRRLCLNKTSADSCIQIFFKRLTERGHAPETLIPVFARAEKNATRFLLRKQRHQHTAPLHSQRKIFLHLQYHPDDPPSHLIQHIWRQSVANPPDETPLYNMANAEGTPVNLDRLVIAYSRNLNLCNIFSV
jgi:hypothetical protein